jgi:UTP:GlnB (protein PII) uridylyltransferase
MTDITARNIESLLQTIQEVSRRVSVLELAAPAQASAVAGLQAQLTELETSVRFLRVSTMGRGGTS